MKNYILIGLLSLFVGGILGYFLRKPETKFLAGETKIEFRDTCITNSVIAEISTETNTTQSTTIKKGKLNKETSVPTTVEITQKDSIYSTVFSKDWNTGLMNMNLKVTVKANSKATAKFDMQYSLDSLVLHEMTHVNNVVVISKDSVDVVPTEVVKYIPLENCPKQTWITLGSSVQANSKNQFGYDFGFGVTSGKLNVSLFKDPTTDFNQLDGYRLGLNLNTLRLSKK